MCWIAHHQTSYRIIIVEASATTSTHVFLGAAGFDHSSVIPERHADFWYIVYPEILLPMWVVLRSSL